MGSNVVDEIDCGSFFDHIDDLIEFPLENENVGLSSTDCKDFPSIWNDPLPDSDSFFSSNQRNSASDLSAEISVPVSVLTVDTVSVCNLNKLVFDKKGSNFK